MFQKKFVYETRAHLQEKQMLTEFFSIQSSIRAKGISVQKISQRACISDHISGVHLVTIIMYYFILTKGNSTYFLKFLKNKKKIFINYIYIYLKNIFNILFKKRKQLHS